MNAAEKEILWRARLLIKRGTLEDNLNDDIVIMGDINETDDIGVVVDLGDEMKYAFFMGAGGVISTSDPELIELALEKMRPLMILDDLADV